MFQNHQHNIICLFLLLQCTMFVSLYNVDRKKTGDVTVGVPTCDGGTRVAQNDSTRSHECVKEMNNPVTGCDFWIDGSRNFGAIDQSDIDLQTQWKIAPQSNVFPFCRSDRRAAVGYVELQDYPNSFKAPIWNERYGRVIKETLKLSVKNDSMTLEAQKLFPGHLFKIFVDCIDEQNVRYRGSKNCVLFKYVGENRYPIIESTLGVTPTTQPPPTNPPTTTAANTTSPSTKPTTTTPKPEPSHKVDRNENGDSIPGAAACDGTYVTRNDSTRSHECLKQMNDPITGCDYLINDSNAFGTIDQSDIDLQTQWKIVPQRSLFPFCLSGRRAVVGYVELQDYPNSLNAPIWNEKYGRVIKETLNFTTGNMSMTLEAQKLFPGHLIKIFIDCIDEQNVRYRDEKSCVLFKYVGENTYPIIASSLGVIPTTTVSPTPTPTPTPTPKADALKSEDDTDWLLIGILIGILLLIILILLIVCLICKRRKDKKRQEKVSKAETKAIEQNVSYRDNPTFMVLDVNDKPQNNGGHAPPESPTGKIPTKGTGIIDSPDGSKITSSAYLFMAGKEPEIKAVPPSNNDNSSKKHYDPVKLNIDMKHKSETEDNASYNVI